MTGQVIELLFDRNLWRFKGRPRSNETCEHGGNVAHLFWRDADSQHRKLGHCLSPQGLTAPCRWRQRPRRSHLRCLVKQKPGTYMAVHDTSVSVVFFRIPWTCLQTKPGSSDSMTTRRNGTWSVTRCAHCPPPVHSASAKSIQGRKMPTFLPLFVLRSGSRSRILPTPTSRS